MTVSFLNNADNRSSILKRNIIRLCITDGAYSLSDLSKELCTSIPTITKLVGELMDEGFLEDLGKQATSGGRKPSIYGLNPNAGYFVGADVRRHHVSLAVTDFKGQPVEYHEDIPFILDNSEKSVRSLCDLIKENISKSGIPQEKIMSYGINLSGRVNHETGYCFSYFLGEDRPLATALQECLGKNVHIENDSRAMCYGEYLCGVGNNEKNMLFLNVSWGLGMGMILDGKLHFGKSGFSGEIGHFPLLDNEQICQCGKTGCLETGASGSAVHRMFLEKLKEGRASLLSGKYGRGEDISLDDIMDAVLEEDVLAIEVVENIGSVLGRAIAGLINIFNPELVVIGGRLAVAKEYLMLPIKSAINKHSLKIVSKDTTIKFSKLGKRGGAIGACALSRSKLFDLL
jgi:transcriptional regulator/sugar kinase